MASLTSLKTSSEAVWSMRTQHPTHLVGRLKRCCTTRVTSWKNCLLESGNLNKPRISRRASSILQRSKLSKFSILRSRNLKLRKKRNFLVRGATHPFALELLKVRERKDLVSLNPPNSASISSSRKMLSIPIISKKANEDISGRERPSTFAITGVTCTSSSISSSREVGLKQLTLLASVAQQSVVLYNWIFKWRRRRLGVNPKLSRKLRNLHSSMSNWSKRNSVKRER